MMRLGQEVLQARGLQKVWADGDRHFDIAIEHLVLRSGDFLAITGASGSGKSTVLDMLSLVLRPEKGGELSVNDGNGLCNVRPLVDAQNEGALADLRSRAYGYIVQTSELIPFLTVLENCTLQQAIAGRGTQDDIVQLAEALDVAALFRAYPSELSVGQRQRIAIIRALCCLPRIVLADEPTASQDPQLKDKVIDLLRSASKRGSAVIMVTHDIDLVDRHKLDRIKIYADGSGKNWRSRFTDQERAPV